MIPGEPEPMQPLTTLLPEFRRARRTWGRQAQKLMQKIQQFQGMMKQHARPMTD